MCWKFKDACLVPCTGLNADISDDSLEQKVMKLQQKVFTSTGRKEEGHLNFREQYKSYKESYVKHLQFDNRLNYSMSMFVFTLKFQVVS